MTLTTHDEHLIDRAAMLAMRGFIAASGGPDVSPEGRADYDGLMERTPIPEGVKCTEGEVGGVPGWWCRPSCAGDQAAILYLHGGCYVLGSAKAYRGVASQIALRVGVATFVADYRLAPENPFPAAFDDACRALDGLRATGFTKVAVVGDSAGGGLGLAALASGAAQTRAVAAAVFSPFIDLSLSGATIGSKADVDPILSREALDKGRSQYLVGADPAERRVNAIAGDLSLLPPMRIDVGEDEVLLDDSVRFHAACEAAGAPTCDLHVWKGMVHVFPANISMLKAAVESLDEIGAFLRGALGA